VPLFHHKSHKTLLELNPVLQSKKPGHTPGVTLIFFFQNSTAIISKSHEMFFVLFAIDVGKMSIRRKIK
jgi:hypothetical protein